MRQLLVRGFRWHNESSSRKFLGSAYPYPDTSILELLTKPQDGYGLTSQYYLTFLKELFDAVEMELPKLKGRFQSHAELALAWRDHFGESQEEYSPCRAFYRQLSIDIGACPFIPLIGNYDSET
jgi:hypothetical protein